jgi:glycosyltransferase involved in cell wall biosynthesis
MTLDELVPSQSSPSPTQAACSGISIVVPTRDRPELLRDCLNAVLAVMRPRDELIVVDSASGDRTTEKVARDAGAHYVRCERPGASRARNCGLAAATRDIVAFTDDDCRPQAGWPEAIQTAFDDPNVCFLFGRVIAAGKGTAASVHDEPTRRVLDLTVQLLGMGHGANMAFRRDPLRTIGGFDELLGAGVRLGGAEDADVIERLLSSGCTGSYEPDACVAHLQWRGRRQVVRLSYGYGLGFGALAAKASRRDRERGRMLTRHAVGEAGLSRAWKDLRNGYQTGTATTLAWTAGVVMGNLRGRRMPTRDGRYAPLFRD